MADGLKRAFAWLGLVEDDRYEASAPIAEQEDTEAVEVEYEPSVVSVLPDRRPRSEGKQPVAAHSDMTRIITVHPRTYNEARVIGEHFRDGVPVIMNLTEMDDTDAKRLVDFAAGLTFGLEGVIERVTNKVFLLSPHNVNVAAEDKERIAAGSFFNQS